MLRARTGLKVTVYGGLGRLRRSKARFRDASTVYRGLQRTLDGGRERLATLE